MNKTRQGIATAVLVCAGIAIVATSEKRWERSASVGGAISIPAGANTVVSTVAMRLVVSGAQESIRPRFQLRVQVPPGFRASISAPHGNGSSVEGQLIATYYRPTNCTAQSCAETFQVHWTRANANTDALQGTWTGQAEVSAAGDAPPNARVEVSVGSP